MTEAVLSIEHVSKRYGSLVAVDNLSLTIRRGELFGFLGPNGAGKTTAIKIMCGLLRPDSGRVLLDGRPMAWRDPDQRARIGNCPQEIVVWSHLSCVEQLVFVGEMYGLSRKQARASSERLLAALALEQKRDVQARLLSGGMKRRLSLALALVHDPEIIVLDEPETGLDPQSRVAVREYIRSLARQKTVILTTHNMDEADRLADRIAIIDHGALLVLDTPAALKRRAGAGVFLEVTLQAGCEDHAQAVVSRRLPAVSVDVSDGRLFVRSADADRLLPELLEALRHAETGFTDIRLRQSSLEDVFIQLTGRRLRE